MKFTYVGKNVDITDAMKEAVELKISRLGNYFNCEKEARVVMSTQKNMHKVEIAIYIKDLIIRAEEVSKDMYVAIDLIIDNLERQLRKQKTRLQKKCHKSIKYQELEMYDDYIEEDSKEIVKRKTILNPKPMSDDEAILQMELLNHNFYMYFNTNGTPSTVYKRKDGNYGIIETC